MSVFNQVFSELAAQADKPDGLMIDATHLKAHRTACSLFKELYQIADKRCYHEQYEEESFK